MVWTGAFLDAPRPVIGADDNHFMLTEKQGVVAVLVADPDEQFSHTPSASRCSSRLVPPGRPGAGTDTRTWSCLPAR